MSKIHLPDFDGKALIKSTSSSLQLLKRLGAPAAIKISGHRQHSPRVITTLLHANEPSGIKALYQLLKEDFVPYCDTYFIVASVQAALTEPAFSHRMLTGQRDLNRCFSGPFNDPQGAVAEAIIEKVNLLSPEAVVDIHNTSGSGPAFGVSCHQSNQHLALASHFCQRVICTDIRLGSLMEQDFGCPVVTIEAGGAMDTEADSNALHGLKQFLSIDDVFRPSRETEKLNSPRRLEISADASISYAADKQADSTITFCQDIEQHNFGITPEHQLLGWTDTEGFNQLQCDLPGEDINQYLLYQEGSIKTRVPLKMFMVTSNAEIAKNDCLFYFVRA